VIRWTADPAHLLTWDKIISGRALDERHEDAVTRSNNTILRSNMENVGLAFEFLNEMLVSGAFVQVNNRIRSVL